MVDKVRWEIRKLALKYSRNAMKQGIEGQENEKSTMPTDRKCERKEFREINIKHVK